MARQRKGTVNTITLEHCWHKKSGNDCYIDYVCCFCGVMGNSVARLKTVGGHGPFAVFVDWGPIIIFKSAESYADNKLCRRSSR